MNSPKALVELLVKLFAGVVGSLYVIGFLVVSIYLAKYGVSSPHLLRSTYLAAGIWASIPPLLAGALLFLILVWIDGLRRYPKFDELPGWQKAVVIVRSGMWALTGNVLVLLLGFSALDAPVVRAPRWLAVLGVAALMNLLVMGGLESLRRTIETPRRRAPKIVGGEAGNPSTIRELLRVLQGSWEAAFVLALLLIYIGLFASFGYSSIPASLGGGQPQPVKLVARPDARTALEEAGIPFGPERATTQPLGLLYDTDHGFVVIGPARAATLVPRELVRAVIYEPRLTCTK